MSGARRSPRSKLMRSENAVNKRLYLMAKAKRILRAIDHYKEVVVEFETSVLEKYRCQTPHRACRELPPRRERLDVVELVPLVAAGDRAERQMNLLPLRAC